MKKIKWMIIILLIILIILLGIVFYIIINAQDGNQFFTSSEEGEAGDVIDYESLQTEQVTSNINFFTVGNCVNQYLDVINLESSIYFGYNENDEYTKIVTDNEIRNNIYSLLSKEYIDENGITIENIYNYVDTRNEDTVFLPLKMNVLTRANTEVYSVFGIEYTLDNEDLGDRYFIVTLDRDNSTFSVEPIKNGTYSDISQIVLENNNDIKIESSDYNVYTEVSSNYEYLCQSYINTYKTLVRIRPTLVYEMLNQEYRDKKFGSIDSFNNYIQSKSQEIQNINLQQYQVNNYDNYTQYVCVDQNGKYHIFNENAVMDFELILDTYTIDLPQFTEQYNNSTDSEKVLLNIQKVFSAINDEDYNYVYNKLDSTFRQNNFPTVESFKTYIKENFYENNSIGYSNYQTSDNLHIYIISITNANDDTSIRIEKNFIMQLLDGTDFVMSFNV